MNLQIVSNASNLVGGVNYNYIFVMTLSETIEAENAQKTIRTLNVSYPLSIENVGLEKCGIRLFYDFRDIRTSGENIKYKTEWIYLPAGHYTLKEMIKTLNRYLDPYDVHFTILSQARSWLSISGGGTAERM
jgi:hypothetical protein